VLRERRARHDAGSAAIIIAQAAAQYRAAAFVEPVSKTETSREIVLVFRDHAGVQAPGSQAGIRILHLGALQGEQIVAEAVVQREPVRQTPRILRIKSV